MEAKRNPYRYDPEIYVHGNTARRLEHAPAKKMYGAEPVKRTPATRELQPVRRPDRKPERDRRRQSRTQVEWNSEHSIVRIGRGLNVIGMLLVGMAVMAIVYFSVSFLKLQAESTRLDKSIALLESELVMMTDSNHAKEESITAGVDLEKIYQTAVGEYGMVFPNKNEVVYYTPACVEYVRQYADIPETVSSILDKIVP